MGTGWDHEVVIDDGIGDRMLAQAWRDQRRGVVVLAVVLLVTGVLAALAWFDDTLLALGAVVVLVAVAVGAQRRRVRAFARQHFPVGMVLTSRFDDTGFDLGRSDGFTARTPWTGVTALEHDGRGGLVTYRLADGSAYTVPEEVFPADELERGRRLIPRPAR